MQDDINSSSVQESRRSLKNLKMIPLILIYQLWVVGVIQAFGWIPALPAIAVTGAWIGGWPKGILNNIVFAFVFAFVLPLFLAVALEFEPSPVTK